MTSRCTACKPHGIVSGVSHGVRVTQGFGQAFYSFFIPQYFITDPSQQGYAAHQAGTGKVPLPPPRVAFWEKKMVLLVFL